MRTFATAFSGVEVSTGLKTIADEEGCGSCPSTFVAKYAVDHVVVVGVDVVCVQIASMFSLDGVFVGKVGSVCVEIGVERGMFGECIADFDVAGFVNADKLDNACVDIGFKFGMTSVSVIDTVEDVAVVIIGVAGVNGVDDGPWGSGNSDFLLCGLSTIWTGLLSLKVLDMHFSRKSFMS